MSTPEKPAPPLGFHEATVADMVECLRGWEEPNPMGNWSKHGRWKFCQVLIQEFDKKGTLSPKQAKTLKNYWVEYWYRPTHKRYWQEIERLERGQ